MTDPTFIVTSSLKTGPLLIAGLALDTGGVQQRLSRGGRTTVWLCQDGGCGDTDVSANPLSPDVVAYMRDVLALADRHVSSRLTLPTSHEEWLDLSLSTPYAVGRECGASR